MPYQTVTDFASEGTGLMPMIFASAAAVPGMFAIILFAVWFIGSAASYFAVLKATGKKRFWHSLTAMSFVCFILSLFFVAMNTATITILSGYWVGFYILMIAVSWYLLATYKE
jgi:hypothetical protein